MGWVVNATPRSLYPQERPGTHCIRKRLRGPQGRSGWVRKISPPSPPEFHLRTVQNVANSCTDWAILDLVGSATEGLWNKRTGYIKGRTAGWKARPLKKDFAPYSVMLAVPNGLHFSLAFRFLRLPRHLLYQASLRAVAKRVYLLCNILATLVATMHIVTRFSERALNTNTFPRPSL